jgi:3-dehydroquinate dehydratase type I
MARNNTEAMTKMAAAAPLADMMEIRLDVMESFDLKDILETAPKPVIVTYRSKKEGGSGLARYETRVRHLLRAVELGADFVDVEFSMPQIYRQEIFQAEGSSRLIISAHLSNKTPPREVLEDRLRKMAATGADIVKIITYAREPEDNLRVLGLIPLARKLGVNIIAFCMGPAGRISRIFTLLMGGYVSFASLEEGQESAAGQIPISKMKKMLEMLGDEEQV